MFFVYVVNTVVITVKNLILKIVIYNFPISAFKIHSLTCDRLATLVNDWMMHHGPKSYLITCETE